MSSSTNKLFTPLSLGGIGVLQHRVVLAPLTRARAVEATLAPSAPLHGQYYRQRASPGGLLITEATNISPESLAYNGTPGLWTEEQCQAWRQVVQGVHDKGGLVVCQLWHTGRVAHSSWQKHPLVSTNLTIANTDGATTTVGAGPVSCSAVPIVNRRGQPGRTLSYGGEPAHYETPRALTQADIRRIVQHDYVRAARYAKRAGFDGIEIHAAHGYLIDQFLNDGVNQRTDEYGVGRLENRTCILREVLDAVTTVWPRNRVGVRLSPHQRGSPYTYNGCHDSNPDRVYTHVIEMLQQQYPELAYLFLTEPRWAGRRDDEPLTDPGFQLPLVNLPKFRSLWKGVLLGAGGFTPRSAWQEMRRHTGDANADMNPSYDALAFGRWFISNPDLPVRLKQYMEWAEKNEQERLQQGGCNDIPPSSSPLLWNEYNRSTFYTTEAEGYIDYPSLAFEEYAREKGTTASAHEYSLDFEGMELNAYPKVDPCRIGANLQIAAGAFVIVFRRAK